MSTTIVNRQHTIAHGKFAPTGNETTIPVPASGATVTLFDSTLNSNGLMPITRLPYERVKVNIYSSHDSAASGVVLQSDFDGTANQWRSQSTQTYTNAGGATTYDFLLKGGQLKVTYQNSANTLTAWEVEIVGDFDKNPGS